VLVFIDFQGRDGLTFLLPFLMFLFHPGDQRDRLDRHLRRAGGRQ
jgi:hypothetical protein